MTYNEVIASPLWEGLDAYAQEEVADPGDQAACFEVEHGGRSLFILPPLACFREHGSTLVFVVANNGSRKRFPDFTRMDLSAWARWLREGGKMPDGPLMLPDEGE